MTALKIFDRAGAARRCGLGIQVSGVNFLAPSNMVFASSDNSIARGGNVQTTVANHIPISAFAVRLMRAGMLPVAGGATLQALTVISNINGNLETVLPGILVEGDAGSGTWF